MSKDTAEPSGDGKPPLRKELVDLAVKFLNNPRVSGSPIETKQAFLKKKGLTDEELNEATQQAQKHAPSHLPLPSTTGSLHPVPPPPPPRSRSWQEYCLIAAIAGGLGYAVLQLVKKYVMPWLLGRNEHREQQQLEAIRASVQELQNSIATAVSELRDATRPVKELLTEQSQQLQALTGQVTNLQRTNVPPSEQLLRDIQGEVGTLKGLLLSRHTFPTLLQQPGDGGIPSWQRLPKAPLPPGQVEGAQHSSDDHDEGLDTNKD